MTESEPLRGPLADVVGEAGIVGAEIVITGTASVGASRGTTFIDICDGDSIMPAVAQIGCAEGTLPAHTEAELLRLAGAAGVPVPPVVAASDRLAGEQVDVLITGRIDGLSIPRAILRSIPDAQTGEALAEQCGETFARVHQLPLDSLPASLDRLDDAAPHEDYCRQLQTRLSDLPSHHPAIRWGLNWLNRNPPSRAQAPTLVHGDFRNGNMLVADGRLAAVLDWELAHIGDPMEDLAWMCLRMWRFGNDLKPCGGFGSVESLRRGYESGGGRWRDDGFEWWLAARSAWWAMGLAKQGAAFRSGESTSLVHAASGRRVAELEYDLLNLTRSLEN